MATEIPSKPNRPEMDENREAKTTPDAVVDSRLSQTRRQLRSVDLMAGLLWLACAAIAWFLIVAVVDHWFFDEGLSSAGRWAMLLLFLAGGAVFSFFRIIRPLLRRVNPIYVAHRIEQSDASAKNSLINFLLLRRSKEVVDPSVLGAMQERAAGDIQRVAPDEAIDWSGVLRIAYLFTALVAIGAIYQVASPKSPFASAARVVAPWTDRVAPTRVRFSEIMPGDLTIFYGEQATISAEVTGLDDGEIPTLYYTTADGQTVDVPVPMSRPEGEYRYQCTIPPEPEGFQQDASYYLAAGDARSLTFRVTADAPPAIAVESIRYDYPSYTKQLPKTVTDSADVVAIEGTKVTVVSKANREIRRAGIDLGCDHLRPIAMNVQDRTASGTWKLRVESDPKLAANQQSYQLLFVDSEGKENPSPIRHNIRVIPDRIPTVQLLDPPGDAIELPINGRLELKVTAEDPDFGLRSVSLRAEREGRGLAVPPMLQTPTDTPNPQKVYEGVIVLEPKLLELKPGDEVEYWAEARDIKTPNANVAQTERRRFIVVEEERGEGREERKDQNGQQGEDQKDQNGQQGEEQKDQNGQQGGDEQKDQNGQQGGDEQKDQNGQQGGEEQKDQNGQQGGEEQKDQGGQQGGEEQKDQGGQQGGDEQKDQSGQQGGEQQNGQNGEQGNQQQSGGGQKQQGESKGGPSEQKQGTPQNGTQKPDKPIDGQANPGDVFEEALKRAEKGDTGQPKDGTPSNEGKPDSAPGEGDQQRPTDDQQKGQPGESKPKDGKSGEGKPGEGQPGEGQPGEEKPEVDEFGQPTGKKPADQKDGKEGTKQEGAGTGEGEKKSPEDQQDRGKPGSGQNQKGSEGDQEKMGEKDQLDFGQEKEGDDNKPSDQDAGKPGEGTDQGPSGKDQGTNVPDDHETPSGNQTDGPGEGGKPLDGQPPEDAQTAKPGDQPPQGETSPHGKDSDEMVDQVSPDMLEDKKPGEESGKAPSEVASPEGQAPKDSQPGDKMAGGTGPRPDGTTAPKGDRVGPDPFDKEAADKKTALALEYLKDQLAKEKPDQDLLDSLGGWSRDDLERFVQRWERMRNAAKQAERSNQASVRRYEEALRSLGLPTGKSELKAGGESSRVEDMRSSRQSTPPSSWRDRINAYQRSIGAK